MHGIQLLNNPLPLHETQRMHCWWRPAAAVWIPWRRASSRRRETGTFRERGSIDGAENHWDFARKTWGKHGENMET
jgi:hypothetical protein